MNKIIGIIQGGIECGNTNMPGVFVSLTDVTVLDFVLEKSGLRECKYFN
jgi:hypothetical protein